MRERRNAKIKATPKVDPKVDKQKYYDMLDELNDNRQGIHYVRDMTPEELDVSNKQIRKQKIEANLKMYAHEYQTRRQNKISKMRLQYRRKILFTSTGEYKGKPGDKLAFKFKRKMQRIYNDAWDKAPGVEKIFEELRFKEIDRLDDINHAAKWDNRVKLEYPDEGTKKYQELWEQAEAIKKKRVDRMVNDEVFKKVRWDLKEEVFDPGSNKPKLIKTKKVAVPNFSEVMDEQIHLELKHDKKFMKKMKRQNEKVFNRALVQEAKAEKMGGRWGKETARKMNKKITGSDVGLGRADIGKKMEYIDNLGNYHNKVITMDDVYPRRPYAGDTYEEWAETRKKKLASVRKKSDAPKLKNSINKALSRKSPSLSVPPRKWQRRGRRNSP